MKIRHIIFYNLLKFLPNTIFIKYLTKLILVQEFSNINGLKRHLEQVHRRTFCEICLKHRLVFIQEQKTYLLNKINDHIENGDAGDDQ